MSSTRLSSAWEDNKSRSETVLYPDRHSSVSPKNRFSAYSGGITRNGSRDESKLHKSLEEITKDIKELEDFISVTEEILKREREFDEQLYRRERQRKAFEKKMQQIKNKCSPTKICYGKSDSAKVKSPTFKVNITQKRRIKSFSPKSYKSKLYFRNGKIGCLEAEEAVSNLKSTHEIVKRIINDENNMLVKLEHQHFTMGPKEESPTSVGTPLESLQMCVTESATSLCDEPFKETISDDPGDNASEPKIDRSESSERIIEDMEVT